MEWISLTWETIEPNNITLEFCDLLRVNYKYLNFSI